MTTCAFLSSKSPGGQLGAGKRSSRSRICARRGGYFGIWARLLSGLPMLSASRRSLSPGGFSGRAVPAPHGREGRRRQARLGTAVCLALALTACAPQPAPPNGRHALDMLRRGYPEWVARCAWAEGRAGHPLETALRRCQLDLGFRKAEAGDDSPIARLHHLDRDPIVGVSTTALHPQHVGEGNEDAAMLLKRSERLNVTWRMIHSGSAANRFIARQKLKPLAVAFAEETDAGLILDPVTGAIDKNKNGIIHG